MKTLFYILAILLLSCSSFDKKENVTEGQLSDKNILLTKHKDDKIHFHKLDKLLTVGDFDGDGIIDTIYQHNFSGLSKREIDSSADPYQIAWDAVVKWFYEQHSDVYLSFNKINKDTLHLGTAQGLYCLLNVGDINKDGNDEIGFVVDYCDFSNLNSCKIYSLCRGKWTELKRFGINESAFEFMTKTKPLFTDIKEYLEKQGNLWVYKDYNKDYGNKMKQLTINTCE